MCLLDRVSIKACVLFFTIKLSLVWAFNLGFTSSLTVTLSTFPLKMISKFIYSITFSVPAVVSTSAHFAAPQLCLGALLLQTHW